MQPWSEETARSEGTDISIELETDTSSKSDSEISEDYSYEYDNLDDEYEELIDKQLMLNSEEDNMEFYRKTFIPLFSTFYTR